jgi:hypothetical protein
MVSEKHLTIGEHGALAQVSGRDSEPIEIGEKAEIVGQHPRK